MLLDGGRVRAEGAPGEVLREPLLAEVYRTPIDVLPHPRGGLVVRPRRAR
ncbi:MAG: hypothetical protein GXX90_11520 [Microbacteriaceae bacterium]|nr:hypothetical protein [Microbacteriaceae bacterium]